MALKNSHKYDDILNLPRPEFRHRAHMSNYDRAAQFSPFAALTGFDQTIEEAGRLTDTRIELDEGEIEKLNRVLQQILERLPQCVPAAVTWFTYDPLKSGGAYVTDAVQIRKIDAVTGTLLLTDGRGIPIDEIIRLQLL